MNTELPEIDKKKLDLYSQEEKDLLKQLDELFKKWNEAYRKSCPEIIKENETIVPDGFYPGYLSCYPKILFLGRESYSLQGYSYIDLFIDNYSAGQYRAGQDDAGEDIIKSINQYKFHKMLIKVSHGIINNQTWDEVPAASEICKEKKIFSKTSFAFMNVSKLSNGDGIETTNTDWDLVNESISFSNGYILEEIKILNPDLIIAMNLGRGILTKIFGECLEYKENNYWEYKIHLPDKRECLLIDNWHFSSSKKEKDCIYDPMKESWDNFRNNAH